MPTYINPIGFASGFRIGQPVPVDDRMIFDDVTDADTYLAATQFAVYEGLWGYLIDPGDYYMCQRTAVSLPYDSTTNPYVWKRFSGTLGGLPALGAPYQQLLMDENGSGTIFDHANQRTSYKFFDAMTANPWLEEGMLIKQITTTTFQDFHTITSYPLNTENDRPLYCVFRIVGNDIWVGRRGIVRSISHGVTERVPLFLKPNYVVGGASYFADVLTVTKPATIGEYVVPMGHAISTHDMYIDLDRKSTLNETSSGSGGSGNATIFRTKIQKYGNGGIAPDTGGTGTDSTFSVAHGFGKVTGIVQVVDVGPLDVFPGKQVEVNEIEFSDGIVKVNIDYGIVDDTSVLEVVLIF